MILRYYEPGLQHSLASFGMGKRGRNEFLIELPSLTYYKKERRIENVRNKQNKEAVPYFSARDLWGDLSDGNPDMVWKRGISGDKCIWKCADVLPGGRGDAGLPADEMGGRSAAQMVLPVFSARDAVDDIVFDIVYRDAGAEYGLEWNGDFFVGSPFPVCDNWRKHSLLDYFVDSGQKEESGLRTRMEAFKNVSALHFSFLCALFWAGGHFLCGRRSNGPAD